MKADNESVRSNLPDINELNDLFVSSQGVEPVISGYASFTTDEQG